MSGELAFSGRHETGCDRTGTERLAMPTPSNDEWLSSELASPSRGDALLAIVEQQFRKTFHPDAKDAKDSSDDHEKKEPRNRQSRLLHRCAVPARGTAAAGPPPPRRPPFPPGSR